MRHMLAFALLVPSFWAHAQYAPATQAVPIVSSAAAPAVKDTRPYAGHVSVNQAYELAQRGEATIVDIRSDAERDWVGFIPGAKAAAWQQWPNMKVTNPDYDAAIKEAAKDGKPVLLLCRSGVRSIDAAKRATELGLVAYSIDGGFEGDKDANSQRGLKNGWRHAGLPWQQK